MKKWNNIGVFLIWTFLTGMCLGYLFLPKRDFSPREKRYLTTVPFVWSTDKAEDFLADQMPLRDFFVGLNAYAEKWMGLQKTTSVWVEDGRLVRRPVDAGVDTAKNIRAVNRLAEKLPVPVTLALVPSAGWAGGDPDFPDGELIEKVYAQAQMQTLDLRPLFQGRPELYYRTDHHWTSAGAAEAYLALTQQLGVTPEKSYTKECYSGFLGANVAASGLWLTEPETLEMYHGQARITVTGEDEPPHDGPFYEERLEGYDPYMVFLDGNRPLVRLHNPEGQGKILLIRDSFASCLAPFLAENYREVVLMDRRYYKKSAEELVRQEDFDQVLVLYSLENFLTDSSLVLLR